MISQLINLLKKLIKYKSKTKLKNIEFKDHEEFIEKKFGVIEEPYKYSILEKEFLVELKAHIKSIKPFNAKSLLYESQRYDPFMSHNVTSEEDIFKLSKLIKNCINLNPAQPIVKKLHAHIRNNFKEYFKSPITFVNSRAWVTPPNSDTFGPNALHKDGFPPGHLKIMIYPYGLSPESGQILIEDVLISNKPPGYMLAFKNSDVLHAGVCGHSKERLSIEITVTRSIIPNIQMNESHFFCRHLYSPRTIYFLSMGKKNKFLSKTFKEDIYESRK